MRILVRLHVAALLPLVLSSLARADGNLVREIDGLSKLVAPELRKAGQKVVAIETVVWADGRPAEAGPAVIEAMANALSQDGFTIDPAAAARVKCVLASVNKDPTTGQPAVRVTAKVKIGEVDRVVGSRLVFGEGALATIYAPTAVVIDPKTPEEGRAIQIVRAATSPPATPPVVPYRIEMLVCESGGEYRVRPAIGGRVTTPEFTTYRLLFTNESEGQVAVVLTIDALRFDEFADKTGEEDTAGRMIVVPAKGTTRVKGWYKNANQNYAFDVMALPAAATARKNAVGVISASVYPCWGPTGPVPAGEERAVLHRSTLLHTAAARVQADNFSVVPMHTGRLRAVLSLRYGN
jgi:hypothetical protein